MVLTLHFKQTLRFPNGYAEPVIAFAFSVVLNIEKFCEHSIAFLASVAGHMDFSAILTRSSVISVRSLRVLSRPSGASLRSDLRRRGQRGASRLRAGSAGVLVLRRRWRGARGACGSTSTRSAQ